MGDEQAIKEENRAAARAFIEEVINEGNFDRFDDLAAEDYVDHTDAPPVQGPGRLPRAGGCDAGGGP